ncbi:MAG: hypothetical protein ABW221_19560 [Vicinamibacteria bacterium]
MDKTEQVAQQHLRSRGFTDVRYEPDGNVPPDFLVDARIAVEVRRLNQHEETTGTPRGLEAVSIPLLHRMRKLLPALGPARGESWYVTYTFERPLLEQLDRNIRLCVDEKARKVAKVRSRYPEWWLLLVDHVAHGLELEDHEELRRLLSMSHSWDKILVVNPLHPAQVFEL